MRTEANAEDRCAARKLPLDEPEFARQKRVRRLLVCADRSAEHDDQIRRRDGGDIINAGVDHGYLVATFTQHGLERAEPLKGDVSKCDALLHPLLSSPEAELVRHSRHHELAAAIV